MAALPPAATLYLAPWLDRGVTKELVLPQPILMLDDSSSEELGPPPELLADVTAFEFTRVHISSVKLCHTHYPCPVG